MTAINFGASESAYVRAQEAAARSVDTETPVMHVVEVFDEGEYTIPSQPDDPVGVLYVLPDAELEAFRAKHDDEIQVLDTYGTDPEEDR